MDISITPLQLTPEKPVPVTGNFTEYKKMLSKILSDFDKKVTPDNAEGIKKEIRPLRLSLEEIQKAAINMYFRTPESLMKSQFKELFEMVAEIEDKADEVIAVEAQKRNDRLSKIFTHYVTTKTKELGLPEDAVDYISFDKHYYNKTQKDSDTFDSLDNKLFEAQNNFVAYGRAKEVINKLKKEFGKVFDHDRFLFMLSPYGDRNDSAAMLAQEEGERIRNISSEKKQVSSPVAEDDYEEAPQVNVFMNLPICKGRKQEYKEYTVTWKVPKDWDKQFKDLVKSLKAAGLKEVQKK